jgi:hypothetical protein
MSAAVALRETGAQPIRWRVVCRILASDDQTKASTEPIQPEES